MENEKVHVKLASNFQTVEFDLDFFYNEEIQEFVWDEDMIEAATLLVNSIGKKVDSGNTKSGGEHSKKAPKEPLISESQKKYMDGLGLPYDDTMTMKEAHALIKQYK